MSKHDKKKPSPQDLPDEQARGPRKSEQESKDLWQKSGPSYAGPRQASPKVQDKTDDEGESNTAQDKNP